ncbi:hypothetical protein ABIE85_001025 [Bradyrhizobium diazoefficiens]
MIDGETSSRRLLSKLMKSRPVAMQTSSMSDALSCTILLGLAAQDELGGEVTCLIRMDLTR